MTRPSLLPLFVYGTLLSDGPRAGLVPGRRRPGRVDGRLYAMPAGYPALVLGGGEVEGEVVDGVTEAQLRLIDHYEGLAEGLYERVVCDVRVGGRTVGAWVYVMARPEARGGVRWPGTRWIHRGAAAR